MATTESTPTHPIWFALFLLRLAGMLLLAGYWLTACSQSPTAPAPVQTPQPAPQPVAACVSANTADITLVNASPTSLTYDVVLDGINRGTLGPGQARTFTVTAGTPHTVISRFTNTSVDACSSTPSFVQCTTQTLTCRA